MITMSCVMCLSYKGGSAPQTLIRYQTWVRNSAGYQLFHLFCPLLQPRFTMKRPRARGLKPPVHCGRCGHHSPPPGLQARASLSCLHNRC